MLSAPAPGYLREAGKQACLLFCLVSIVLTSFFPGFPPWPDGDRERDRKQRVQHSPWVGRSVVRFDARVGHADTGKINNGNKREITLENSPRTILIHLALLGDFVFSDVRRIDSKAQRTTYFLHSSLGNGCT